MLLKFSKFVVYLPSAYKVGIGTLGRIAPAIGYSGPHSSGGT